MLKARNAEEAWVEESTAKVGEWRSLTRSVYLRWAITINASELAEARYAAKPADEALQTTTLRMVEGAPAQVPIAVWPSQEAAERYAQVTPLIAAYGVMDLFGAIEDVVFELCEIFHRHHPEALLEGPEFRNLRGLRRRKDEGADAFEAWQKAWEDRYEGWRRKRLYDGLHNVLRGYFQHAGLKRPSRYKHTDVDDWCRTLEMIGELRNLVVHGAAQVSAKLAEMSGTATSMTFDFKAGDQLEVKLHHLQSVECFSDQLLTAVNLALVEKVMGPLIGKPAKAADRK